MKIKLQKKLISKVESRIVFAIEEYKKSKMQTIPAVDNQAILRTIREELSLWATKPRLIYEVVTPIVDIVVAKLKTPSGRKAKTAVANRVMLKTQMFGTVREAV